MRAGFGCGWSWFRLDRLGLGARQFRCNGVLVLVLVLLGGPGSVQPWVLALAPVLLRLVLARLVVE